MPKKLLNENPSAQEALVYLHALCDIELTDEAAAALLGEHGSLERALNAIARSENAPPALACLALLLLGEGESGGERPDRRVESTEEMGAFFEQILGEMRSEQLYLLCLDDDSRAIDVVALAEGDESSVALGELPELPRGARSAVLAHNHPRAAALPSQRDVASTALIAERLRERGVALLDHLIIGADGFVSLRESGMYSPEKV